MSNRDVRTIESPAVECPSCKATVFVGFDARGGEKSGCSNCGNDFEIQERVTFQARSLEEDKPFQHLGNIDEIPAGASKVFRFGKREIAVFQSDGRYFAVKNLCPHHGVELSHGSISGNQIRCPGHGYSFDLDTGRCDRDPSLCASTFEVKVDSGELFVRI